MWFCKTRFLLLFLSISFYSCKKTEVKHENYYVNKELTNIYSIYFNNKNQGWVGGNEGIILRTSDGGLSWRHKNYTFLEGNTSGKYSDIAILNGFIIGIDCGKITFKDDLNGIAFGQIRTKDFKNYFTIFKTIDGGVNWAFSLNEFEFKDVLKLYSFQNTSYALASKFIIGNCNYSFYNMSSTKIFKTNDDWETISLLDLPISNDTITDIFFINSDKGYALTNNSLLVTTNGGIQWNNLFSIPDKKTAYKVGVIFFATENIGYIFKENLFYKTTDGGKVWNSFKYYTLEKGYLNNIYYFNKLCFTNKNNFILYSDELCFIKTTDGGVNFSLKDPYQFYTKNNLDIQVCNVFTVDSTLAFAAVRNKNNTKDELIKIKLW